MKINLMNVLAPSVATKTEEPRKYVPLSQVVEVTVIKLEQHVSKKGNNYFVIEVEDKDGGTHDGLLINLSGVKELALKQPIKAVCNLHNIKGKWSRTVIV